MKNLVMSLCVTVTGPPSAICFLNSGITEPLEPKTLPNLTATNVVSGYCLSIIWMTISQIRFVAPMMFVGLTALSVEIRTNFLTPASAAAFAVLYVPITLFLIASFGLSSIRGTCLCAAAWNTISGLYFCITELIL